MPPESIEKINEKLSPKVQIDALSRPILMFDGTFLKVMFLVLISVVRKIASEKSGEEGKWMKPLCGKRVFF